MLVNSKRLAIVTGATRGMGHDIALRLVQEGYTVVAVDVDEVGLSQLRTETVGSGLITRAADVGDPSFAKALMQELNLTGLELLVNNAGVRFPNSILDTTDEEWDVTLRTNLSGPFYLMREVGRAMADAGHGGLIINIASVGGLVGVGNRASYCASKGGLVLLTKAAALDLGSAGVRVIAICPGVFTQMAGGNPNEVGSFVKENVPLGKVGDAKDIAQVVVDLTRWPMATGTTVVLDGGMLAGFRT